MPGEAGLQNNLTWDLAARTYARGGGTRTPRGDDILWSPLYPTHSLYPILFLHPTLPLYAFLPLYVTQFLLWMFLLCEHHSRVRAALCFCFTAIPFPFPLPTLSNSP